MRALRGSFAALGVLACAAAAVAFVPTAERIHSAMSETNVASGRDEALRLEMSVQIGERAGVATAELISHPTGLARLELRGHRNLVERHLLQGNVAMASRNGQMLDEHRYFLPPVFLLQADTHDTLRTALESLDVLVDVVGLTECGELDCYVIGDPSREVVRAEPPPLPGLEVYEQDEDAEEDEESADLAGEGADPEAGATESEAEVEGRDGSQMGAAAADDDAALGPPPPNIVVDLESYEIRGIETASGVSIELGPIAAFEKLRVPAWIVVREPERAPVRFDVLEASQVNAPASVFTQSWLVSPVISDPSPAEPSPVP